MLLRKFISIALALSLTSLTPVFSHAEDSDPLLPKSFTNSVLFGTAVGLIIGFAAGGGTSGTMRATSLGFYGGILLGIYISTHESKDPQSENIVPQSSLPKSPSYFVTFHF